MTTSLVIQTSFLGDTVLTTPLIGELAARGPVDVIVTPPARNLLANDPRIRELFVYDKRGDDRGVSGLARTAGRVRARWRARGEAATPATAYLAQGSMRSAALAMLVRARERVGFADAPGRLLYTRRVVPAADQHHAARLLGLAAPAPAAPRPQLFPGPAERDAVDALIGALNAHDTLIALAPGSVWGTKRWPYYAELARRLAARHRLVVVGGPDDATLAHEIIAAAPERTIDATGRLSLLASAELIRRAHVLVTNDSLPQHLASAMGTATVAIFGPTVPAFGFGPLAPRSVTLGVSSLICRPCHHHGPPSCPLGHWRCMRDLDVRDVEAAVDGIMTVDADPSPRSH